MLIPASHENHCLTLKMVKAIVETIIFYNSLENLDS